MYTWPYGVRNLVQTPAEEGFTMAERMQKGKCASSPRAMPEPRGRPVLREIKLGFFGSCRLLRSAT